MKIKEIGTKNFKNAPDMKLALDHFTVLSGENGKGKTSLLHSVRYVLTGNLPSDPIRHGEDSMSVTAVLDDGQNTVIERTMFLSDSYQINGKEEKEKAFTQEVKKLHARVEANQEQIVIGKNANQFFLRQSEDVLWEFLENGRIGNAKIHGIKELEVELADGTTLYMRKSQPSKVTVDGKKVSAKAVSEMLSNRMNGDAGAFNLALSSDVMAAVENTDFSRYLISIIPVQSDFDNLAGLVQLSEEKKAILKPLFPLSPNPVSISDIGAAYKKLFAARAEISRNREEWKKKSVYTGNAPKMEPDVIKSRLKDIQGQIGAAQAIEKAWEVYNERVQERKKSSETLKAWVEEYQGIENVRPVDQRIKNALQLEEKNLRTGMDSNNRSKALLENQKKLVSDMLTNLNTSVCPLCDKLTCTTDKSTVKSDLETSMKEIEEGIRQYETAIEAQQKRLDEIAEEKEKIQRTDATRKQKIEMYERIDAFRKTIPDLPEKPENVPDIAALQKEYQEYESYQQEALLMEECRKAEKMYEQLTVSYEMYNELVKLCEPKKGLLTQRILQLILDPFKDHCNDFLKSVYGNYEIAFDMTEEGLQVYCKTKNNPSFTSVHALSKGEKMLVILSLMDMVSTITNSRMICFDDMEQFDTDTIDQLMKLLTKAEIQNRYDHILMAPVNHKSIMETIQKYSLHVSVVDL